MINPILAVTILTNPVNIVVVRLVWLLYVERYAIQIPEILVRRVDIQGPEMSQSGRRFVKPSIDGYKRQHMRLLLVRGWVIKGATI
jgi:hypothetical protein